MIDLPKEEKRKIAQVLVKESMRIGKKRDGSFDSVYLRYNGTDPSCEEFAYMVEEECWKVGAYVLPRRYSSLRMREMYSLAPEESIKQMDPLAEAIAKTADVRMFIGEEDDPNWSEGLTEKYKASAPIRQRLWEIMDAKGMRWVYFGWPIPGSAKAYGCGIDEFRNIFFDSIRHSFSAETRALSDYYHSALKDAKEVRIVSKDTDLSFSVEGRHALVDDHVISDEDLKNGDVGMNIPCGEVFVAPIETSANGQILFPTVVIPGFGKINDLRLTFKDGKVVRYDARSGAERFGRFLSANTGEKDRIAELGIGTNPGAKFTGGSIIIDEKIYRTIHIAIGNNTGSYHGKNKASSHLDMIKDMSEGRMYFDGRLVMDNGVPANKG